MIDGFLFTEGFFVDQMGVELGKVLAKNILSQLSQPSDVIGHDSSVRLSFYCDSLFADTKVTCADCWSYSLLPKAPKRMNRHGGAKAAILHIEYRDILVVS